MVYINFKDLEGLRIQSEQGAKMGFTGKQVNSDSETACALNLIFNLTGNTSRAS